MALFGPSLKQNALPPSSPDVYLFKGAQPRPNYQPVSDHMFAPSEVTAVMPTPVAVIPLPVAPLAFGGTGYNTPSPKRLNFPSPIKLFTRPRNVFGT